MIQAPGIQRHSHPGTDSALAVKENPRKTSWTVRQQPREDGPAWGKRATTPAFVGVMTARSDVNSGSKLAAALGSCRQHIPEGGGGLGRRTWPFAGGMGGATRRASMSSQLNLKKPWARPDLGLAVLAKAQARAGVASEEAADDLKCD